MTAFRRLLTAAALVPLPLLSGCEEPAAAWSNIDLDGVLAAAVETLEEPPPAELAEEAEAALAGDATADADAAGAPADPGADAVTEIPMNRRVPALDDAFLRAFEANLNDDVPPLSATPLAVRFSPDGSLIGSTADATTPGSAAATDLFQVQVDAANSRLVATDLQDPDVNRESGYTFRPGGFFMGYMIGSMLGGQRGFYGRTPGSGPGSGPGFGRMSMAPDGYAKKGSGFGTSRSRAASSRSLGGSKSFMGGK